MTTIRRRNKVKISLKGLDPTGTLPLNIKVPDQPTHGPEDPALRSEQQVLRTEILMVKGIRVRHQLMTLLDVKDYREMDRYIKRVHARWELLGANKSHARHRGEGLQRLDLIESELWSKVSNNSSATVVNQLLSTILAVQKQRSEMLGLTPKVIERLGDVGEGEVNFSRQVSMHERLSMLASRMTQLIEERMKVIEHVPAEEEPI